MSASPRHESKASPVTLPDQTGGVVHPSVLRAGEMLRRLREEKGLTLEEMAKRTRIRSTHLQALECGRIDTLPGQVFVLGFLRLYARNLECPNTELIEACVADLETTQHILQNESFVSAPAPRHRPAIWMVITGLMILVGLFVAYEYHMAEISSAIGLPAPPNAAPLRVGEAIPTRSSADSVPQTEDKSLEDTSSGKGVGLDDPSLWPATDSSPERVTYVTSGQRPDAPVSAKPDAKLASRLESKPGPKLESKLELKPTTAKPDATVSVQSTPKPDSNPVATVTSQPALQPATNPGAAVTAQLSLKPDTKPTTTVTAQPAPKLDTKPTTTVTAQPAPKPDTKPTTTVTAQAAPKPDTKPTTTVTAQPASKPDAKPTTTVTAQPASKPDAKPTTTVTAQPTSKPDAKPETDLASQPEFGPDSDPEPTPDKSATTSAGSLFNSVLNRFFSRDTSETSVSPKTLPPVEESVSDPMSIMNDPMPAKNTSGNGAWNAVPLTRSEPPPPATTTVASDSTKTKPPVAARSKKLPKEIKERYPEPVNGESDLAPESPNAVSLLANELVWVQIKDQNGIVKDMVMQPGFLFHIPEGGQFTATLGNAAAIRVRVGAKELPLMGAAGSMIEGLKLNPDLLRKRIPGP